MNVFVLEVLCVVFCVVEFLFVDLVGDIVVLFEFFLFKSEWMEEQFWCVIIELVLLGFKFVLVIYGVGGFICEWMYVIVV